MHSTIGLSHRREVALPGDLVMREAMRAPRPEVPRGLDVYLKVIHAERLADTAEFQMRRRQGERIQARLRGN
jgi:hypothetical protein